MGTVAITKNLRNFAGPVAQAYELSDLPVSVIIGPTGGGKTESSVRRILRVARSQHPSPIDGIRKCRIVCVGTTYRDLWDKAIPSYLKVFAKDFGQWQGGKGDPATHIMDFIWSETGADGQVRNYPLHIEVWFRAKSGEQSLEDFVRGLECTAWWLQELDQLDESIISLTSNRVGRYPQPEDRWDPEDPVHAALIKRNGWAPAFKGVWGDSNRPVLDSWLHRYAFVEKRLMQNGRNGLFMQPPGLLDDGTVNPRAENLHNLRRIYPGTYREMAKDMDVYDVDRLLKCKAKHDRRGQPVYPQFSDIEQTARDMEIDMTAPLIIGADTGNTLKHAAAFCQPTKSGALRCLAEISPKGIQLNIETFAAEIKRIRSTRFRHIQDVTLVVDPAARSKMVSSAGSGGRDMAYWQYMAALTGLDTMPADTNDPGVRRTALEHYLDKRGGFLVDDEACPDITAALTGGYSFRKVGNALSPEPQKNDYSHPAEALEYVAVYLRGNDIYFGAANPSPLQSHDETHGVIF